MTYEYNEHILVECATTLNYKVSDNFSQLPTKMMKKMFKFCDILVMMNEIPDDKCVCVSVCVLYTHGYLL